MKKTFYNLLFLLLLADLTGCAVNPVSGKQDLVLMSEDQELAIGRKSHAEIIGEYGEYKDDKLARYVQRVGEEVAKNSHRSNLIYRFTILDSPEVNAFALPGGYIYVTRGILAYLNSEAELAAVLGHEVGHVTARHAVRRHSTATLTGIAGAILASASGSQGAGDLTRLLGTALVQGYGREHELEADRLGAEYLAKTGYRPEAMLDVVRLLKNQETFEAELAKLEGRSPRTYHGLFASHPDNDKRLQSIIKAGSKKAGPGTPLRDEGRRVYLSAINGLSFGENADEGVLREQNFYHAGLDFFIRFPDHWRVKNKPDRLLAYAPDNDGLLVLTTQDRNRRITPEQYFEKRLNLDNLRAAEKFTHHGMEGFTAIAEASTEYGNRLSRFIVLYHGTRAYVIAGVSKSEQNPYQYDKAILSTGQSFRPLRENERLYSLARKISVKKYQGQSYSDLAKKSGLNHLAESQIRLLNNHYPKGVAVPGDLIKTVE